MRFVWLMLMFAIGMMGMLGNVVIFLGAVYIGAVIGSWLWLPFLLLIAPWHAAMWMGMSYCADRSHS